MRSPFTHTSFASASLAALGIAGLAFSEAFSSSKGVISGARFQKIGLRPSSRLGFAAYPLLRSTKPYPKPTASKFMGFPRFSLGAARFKMTATSEDASTATNNEASAATYPFTEVQNKWQAYWKEHQTFRTDPNCDKTKPKYYVLDMFPYPSGAGLHVGHPEGYTATDILSRYKKMNGYNVMHPMGWDAFGLPAEQYAIQTGTHPRITTERNINRFREQLQVNTWRRPDDRPPGICRMPPPPCFPTPLPLQARARPATAPPRPCLLTAPSPPPRRRASASATTGSGSCPPPTRSTTSGPSGSSSSSTSAASRTRSPRPPLPPPPAAAAFHLPSPPMPCSLSPPLRPSSRNPPCLSGAGTEKSAPVLSPGGGGGGGGGCRRRCR